MAAHASNCELVPVPVALPGPAVLEPEKPGTSPATVGDKGTDWAEKEETAMTLLRVT